MCLIFGSFLLLKEVFLFEVIFIWTAFRKKMAKSYLKVACVCKHIWNSKQFSTVFVFLFFYNRLHMLCELEHSIGPMFQQPDGNHSRDSLNWCARIEMTQNSYRAKEPILALRRALLSLSKRWEHDYFLSFHVVFSVTLWLFIHVRTEKIKLVGICCRQKQTSAILFTFKM